MKAFLNTVCGLVGLALIWGALWGWTILAYAMRTP
jgi:hypothetical protein